MEAQHDSCFCDERLRERGAGNPRWALHEAAEAGDGEAAAVAAAAVDEAAPEAEEACAIDMASPEGRRGGGGGTA